MQCPIDSEVLHKITYEGGIETERCSSCGGLWLDHRELEAIQNLREHDYREELATITDSFEKSHKMALARHEESLSCPSCQQEMEKREYAYCSQIMIDVCPSCRGVWLHDDEIRELEIFFERAAAKTEDIRKGFFAGLKLLFT